jgi:Tetratricopeptide repeat
LHNIGGRAHAAGRPADGEAAARQAVSIHQRTGSEHHEVGVTLGKLGAIDGRRGHLDLAGTRLRRALAIKEQYVGRTNLELVPTLGTLRVVYQSTGGGESSDDRLRGFGFGRACSGQ